MASTTARRGRRAGTSRKGSGSVLVLHGPNLNLLGTADQARWGTETLAEVDARLVEEAARRGWLQLVLTRVPT